MPIPQTTERERERAVGSKSRQCMDPDASASGAAGEGPSSSSAAAAADTDEPAQGPEEATPQSAAPPPPPPASTSASSSQQPPSRYESQKRRDWNTFLQYLKNHKPPLTLARCSGAHVIEFLKYLDQFGKTKVHAAACPYFGQPAPPAPCACPLRQAWGSLDALIGRLRAAFEENGGKPEANPFGARPVRIYLREVRESQAKARGIPYEKKKRKRLQTQAAGASSAAAATAAGGGESSTVERPASPAAADPAVGGDGSGSGAKEGPSAPETSGGGSTS